MTPIRRFLDWFTGGLTARPEPIEIGPAAKPGPAFPAISATTLSQVGPSDRERAEAMRRLFPVPKPPPVSDPDAAQAMDSAWQAMDLDMSTLYGWAGLLAFGEGIGFMGFPYLSELFQRTEYRAIIETIAEEMTRKWIRLTYTGDDPQAVKEKLADLKDAIERHKIQSLMNHVLTLGEGFGRGHIFIDTRGSDTEVQTLLVIDKRKIKKGAKVAFRSVEPMWIYPNTYNSNDPLRPDYYRPTSWFVMARTVHQSRLMTFVPHPVPDMLKPAYSFGGLSLSQLAKPYVDNWIRTQRSVGNLIHSFSITVLATDLSTLIQEGGQAIIKRAHLWAGTRDNQGIEMIDKGTEEISNVSTPMTNIDTLQMQALDQVCMPAKIPRVKFVGQQPSGLGADSEGEIRVFYDHIHARQELLMKDPLLRIIQILQLVEFGEIDPDIGFIFEPLYQLDETEKSANRKTKAEADQIYVNMGSISNEEVRESLASDEESPYVGIDVADMPEPPEDPTETDAGSGSTGGTT